MSVQRALYRSLLQWHHRLRFALLPHLSYGSSKQALRASFTHKSDSLLHVQEDVRKAFQALRLLSGTPDPLLAQVLGLWVLALRGLDLGQGQAVVLEDAAVVLAIWNRLLSHEVSSDQDSIQRQLGLLAQEVCQLHMDCESKGEEASLFDALNEVLFETHQLRGNTDDYYDPANSLIDKALESRKGNPLMLTIIYMAVARRCGLRICPIALPSHVLVYCPAQSLYVDVFNQGRCIPAAECLPYARDLTRSMISADHLRPAPTAALLPRMVQNLKNAYALQPDADPDGVRAAHLSAQLQMLRDWAWPSSEPLGS